MLSAAVANANVIVVVYTATWGERGFPGFFVSTCPGEPRGRSTDTYGRLKVSWDISTFSISISNLFTREFASISWLDICLLFSCHMFDTRST